MGRVLLSTVAGGTKYGHADYRAAITTISTNAHSPRRHAARTDRSRIRDILSIVMAPEKTFYLETFGCQMNAHDSEKVIGTLQREGYRQVDSEEQAGLILYNTCSIRDKAEQKVFNRLNDYKKLHKAGKRFGVLGCVAQQEGEKIFERAPFVSLVSGSASYRNLPEMLARLEAGESHITGLDDRQTDETFETELPPARTPTAATSPSSKAATSSAPTASSHTP